MLDIVYPIRNKEIRTPVLSVPKISLCNLQTIYGIGQIAL